MIFLPPGKNNCVPPFLGTIMGIPLITQYSPPLAAYQNTIKQANIYNHWLCIMGELNTKSPIITADIIKAKAIKGNHLTILCIIDL